MTLAAGTVNYTFGTPPVTGRGVSWTAEELDSALAGPVTPVLFDHQGTADIAALLESLPATDFESDELAKILTDDTVPKDWEVGEALAEVYLTHHRETYFPWPDGRDIRKPKSSLPGADMIGFHGTNEQTKFAFAEVKTSAEDKYPPQVVRYGEHSLNKQLADLRDKQSLRDKAVVYLGHRAVKSVWQVQFRNAAQNYLRSGSACVAIFGILIRDVQPNRDDLSETERLLSVNCPTTTLIELLAIYLPAESIKTLSKTVMASSKGGDA